MLRITWVGAADVLLHFLILHLDGVFFALCVEVLGFRIRYLRFVFLIGFCSLQQGDYCHFYKVFFDFDLLLHTIQISM